LLLQKVAVDRAGTHHDNPLLERAALCRRNLILLFGIRNLIVERDKPKITPLPRNQMIPKIQRQTHPDHGDQVLAENISLFDESLHPSTESHPIPRVNEKRDFYQRLMWVHTGNKPDKRFI